MSVASPTHNATVVKSGYQGHNRALASIVQSDGAPLTEHWILQVGLAQRHAPVARVQKYNDSYVAMVALHPEMNEEQVFSEIIFVVDRSGSMAGSKMTSGGYTRLRYIYMTYVFFNIDFSATNFGAILEIIARRNIVQYC